jgi:hypothetical protein
LTRQYPDGGSESCALSECDFEWKDGTTTHIEELTYQRWEEERIAEETFFYDPAQLVPKKLNT